MTQDETKQAWRWISPTACVARRVKELRARRGWTAAELANRCADKGLDGLNRSVLANIESGRRKYVTVEELLTLAYVLDVAPIHLLVPVEVDESYATDDYLVCPDVFLPIPAAREWVRGAFAPPAVDPRLYYSEVPREEWTPGKPSEDEMRKHGEKLTRHREILDTFTPPGHQAKGRRKGHDDGQHQ